MAIPVKTPVSERVLLAQNPAVTTVIISDVNETVVIRANHVHMNALGSVHIRNARSPAERSVTARGATSHARRSYRAAIPVLGFVAKFARRCVEFVTRMSSLRARLNQCS